MQANQWVQQISRNDLKLIGRDRFLLMMFGFNVYIALVLRFLLPWADKTLQTKGLMPGASIPFSLAETYPLILAYFTFFEGAVIAGIIFGFMLLDEKDENTLQAILVTPVPIQHYLGYRIVLSYLTALIFISFIYLGIGQVPISVGPLLLLTLGGALTAPIVLLFFTLTAENKVQGFAMSKFTGVAGWVILFGWFIPQPWQWLFGLFPPFWISKAHWLYLEGNGLWLVSWGIGVLLQVILIYGLIKRLEQKLFKQI